MKRTTAVLIASVFAVSVFAWGLIAEDKPTSPEGGAVKEGKSVSKEDHIKAEKEYMEKRKKELVDFYQANYPDVLAMVKEVAGDSTNLMVEMLMSTYAEFREMAKLKDQNPEKFKVWLNTKMLDIKNKLAEVKSKVMADGIRKLKENPQADPKEIEAKQAELKKLLEETFNARLEREKQEVAAMERKVEEYKKNLKEREENRDKIIEKRYSELTGSKDNLEW